MAVSHVKTSPIADMTGTVTVFNSAGITTTAAATDLVRPSDYNSAHNQYMTLAGNTAGVSTLSGTNIVLQGGNNVVLSGNAQTIIFSASNAAIGLNSAITQNGVSMTANSSGLSLNFPAFLTTARGSNDAIGLNTAQTNVTWTVNSAGISLNASGYAGTGYTSTTTAGTNIVATNNTAGLSLAFPAMLTTAAASNHSHGNPTLALTNLSGTTASASNGLTLSLSAAAPGAATLSGYAVSNTTNSTSGTFPGIVSFGGYGGISLGVSNGTVQVSGPDLTSLSVTGALSASSNGSTISLGVGTVTASIIGNTTQTSTGTINLNALVFSAAGGGSMGFSAGSIIVSGAAAGGGVAVTISDAASSATIGRLAFTNLNGVTLSLSTGAAGSHTIVGSHNALTTAAASNHSHGNPTLALTNLSGTTASASNGLTLSLSAAAQTNQSAIKGFGVSDTGATAGNTGISTGVDWVLAGSQSLTLSQSTAGGGPNTVWIQHPAWLTTAAASNHSHGNPTLALTNLSGTTASASNGLTLSLSAAAQTNQSAIRGFGVSNTGVTAGNTGISTGIDWVLAGSQSLTLSQSTAGGGPNTVWIQHPAWITTARASNDAIGLNTANTNVTWTVNSSGLSINAAGYAGTGTSITGGAAITLNSVGLAFNGASLAGTSTTFNGANISGSMTHNTLGLGLSLSVAPPGAATITAYAVSNTTQSTSGTIPGSVMSFQGAGGNSVGVSNGSIIISAPGTSSLVAAADISISTNGATITISRTKGTASGYSPYADLIYEMTQLGQGVLILDPMRVGDVQFDRVMVPIYNTNSSNSSGSHTLSFWAGLYSRNVSTLSLYGSASTTYAVTHSGTQGVYASLSGLRLLSIPWTTTIADGQYWFGLVSRTTSGGANGSWSQLRISAGIATDLQGLFSAAANTTVQITLGQGSYTATTSGMPASIGFTQLQGSGSGNYRAPVVWFASSTV